MKRFDEMTRKEFENLYRKSLYLAQIGFLAYAAAWILLLMILVSVGYGVMAAVNSAEPIPGIVWVAALLGLLIGLLGMWMIWCQGYVYRNVRSPGARVFLYVAAGSFVVFQALGLAAGVLLCFWNVLMVWLAIVQVILLGIGVILLQAASSKELFGETYYTHKQLRKVRKAFKRETPFCDEDLQLQPKRAGKKEITLLVFAYIGLLLSILHTLVVMFR